MENETVKEPIHCSPGDGGLCVNSDGTMATIPAVEEESAAVNQSEGATETLPVEKLEVSTSNALSSCASCNSIGFVDISMFSAALLIPLFIKYFKRI